MLILMLPWRNQSVGHEFVLDTRKEAFRRCVVAEDCECYELVVGSLDSIEVWKQALFKVLGSLEEIGIWRGERGASQSKHLWTWKNADCARRNLRAPNAWKGNGGSLLKKRLCK